MNAGRISVVGAALVTCGLGFSQGPGAQDPVARRIDVLEQDVVSTRQRAEALATELTDVKTTLANVLKFLNEQSKSAQAMSATLDESEKAGFTAGINFESRHILLQGWREQLQSAQKPPTMAADSKKPEEKKPADATPAK